MLTAFGGRGLLLVVPSKRPDHIDTRVRVLQPISGLRIQSASPVSRSRAFSYPVVAKPPWLIDTRSGSSIAMPTNMYPVVATAKSKCPAVIDGVNQNAIKNGNPG